MALGGIEEGGLPVRRVALSTPEQGKYASAYRTVNVGLSSSYDSHVSYIFVAAISMCPLLIPVVHAGVPNICRAPGCFEGSGVCRSLWRNAGSAAWP